jgi:MFS family permease
MLLKDGLKFALSRPVVRTIFAVDLIAMIFGMPRAVFPALADSLGMGADGVGLLFAAPAVGALAGALLSGWVGGVVHQGRAIFLAVFGWGLAITGAGLATFSLPLMLVLFAAAGGSDVLSAVFRGTVLQQTTPDQLRGRVSALDGLVVTGGPRLGDVEAGLVASAIGPAGSVLVGGAACVLFTGMLWLKSPQLKAYRSVAVAEV